jgi:membrane protein DedA with SNARE-associated domain
MAGGVLASRCVPEHSLRIFIWVYIGSVLSAFITYWVGRFLGPRVFQIHWFNRILTLKRVETTRWLYDHYGMWVFIGFRFVPGGIRHAMLITAGLIHMPFKKFLERDLFACFISTLFFFFLGFYFGENWELLLHYFRKFEHWIIGIVLTLAVAGGLTWWWLHHRKVSARN